ncbi:MAG: ornithine cyclodeaminase family protein [Acidimicrobiales bacterium]
MGDLLVLSEDDVRLALPLDELAESLTQALVALSQGAASGPPRVAATNTHGWFAAMPGYVPGLGLGAKLVSVYPQNPERGVVAHQALVAVFDEATGAPCAVMGGTYITAIRTAMTSAIAARALARPGVTSLAIVGAGAQGEAHLAALSHLLALGEVRVTSRHRERAAELAGRHPLARAVRSAEEAVQGADVVCCCSDAREPVICDEWVAPGAHVSSVGTGAELPAALLARGRVFVESRTATSRPPVGAVELQGCAPASLTEIGEVLAGRRAGREAPGEVTVFKSTGHAVEDVAAAAVVVRRARALGAGTIIPSFG